MKQGWTLVTGSAEGLGCAIVKACASKGWPVVIHYRHSQEKAEQLCDEIKQKGKEAATIQGDFKDLQGVNDFIERYQAAFKETCRLVNNVGNYLVAPSYVTPAEMWYELFQTNFHAAVSLTQALLPALRKRRGTVVNMGVAGVGKSRSDVYSPVYTITKEALWAYTCSLAKELLPMQVRVNMVSPGYTENTVDFIAGEKVVLEEVARAVVFCLDEKQSYMTGQNLAIAGGARL